ncbi:hypothetical protein GN958_ATG07421 [Phytophthora infestans]|uniref:Uncharacterized protein n=1 Tax=Phytophthora infestans TaxID=4787 RepID=A0A8S9UR10_PHYIN|nr:hypothetical protein GN958_ATG07421 [Phytophthora infestans]
MPFSSDSDDDRRKGKKNKEFHVNPSGNPVHWDGENGFLQESHGCRAPERLVRKYASNSPRKGKLASRKIEINKFASST